MRKQLIMWLGIAGAAGLFAGMPAKAADGDVSLGGEVILRIRFPSGGLTVQQRADKVTERLVNIIGDPTITAQDIYAKKVGLQYALFVRKQLIVTADLQAASANGTTSEKLAMNWLKTLKRVVPECVPRIFPITPKPAPKTEGSDKPAENEPPATQ
ncbi:MAG: hypothetical protein IT210_25870 [Armatimonadetes bacterium]|nr:hypothetical protein [Armatimonadota bacterium]